MKREDFKAIIEFAIEREREAVTFYQELQEKVKFKSQQEMLKELEMMERGHITVLTNILEKGAENIVPKNVEDLHISEYLVKGEPSGELTYQDILIVAMKREEASTNLYKDLAKRFKGTETEGLFQRLAEEEGGHKLKFEKLYDEEILKNN
ncbi:MAG: ferritin family protein [Candidatus Cloacimonetes bacterium]|nr:ferritin family protein [Candidatus Cloacimonadota bacterium]